jgi:RimJ/RimL family protein N-acetyltransferase
VIRGDRISLRPVREEDLETFHRYRTDIETRGPWMPLPRVSFAAQRADFARHGWWSADEGRFMIADSEGRTVGYVAWELLNGTIPDVELGYGLFDRAEMGKGYTTEAVDLLAEYLFDVYQMNRLALYIHPDNAASLRVAQKCGFTKEATAREAWYNRGRWTDIDMYVLTRRESEARRQGAPVAATTMIG